MFHVGFECFESVGWYIVLYQKQPIAVVLTASLRFSSLRGYEWVWGSDLLTGIANDFISYFENT